MPVDLAALAAELTAGHPVSGVYNADAALAAAQINALDVVQIRASMTGAEIFAATDPTEYNSKTADEKNQWLAFCGITEHDPADLLALKNEVNLNPIGIEYVNS